ncbi:LPS export ABC transporter periplasmic protein LptC [Ignatzschineria rhizosphaerae]|uniref:LPS export ABC transporter periplasmic protein LptC n=1 Tax=Ignatzschineria rhizosphaerae TaxID=2923279 RepID=A0ABY3X5H4_9GAMM|nr:LPS export ABC transporter periplasmic protein LptC [Ignatzschineria rhizosphaerae]UNM96001.1 LPS export ABC transporter periplasmic protein LptC [Ignatzschineria rhizosphaerae]
MNISEIFKRFLLLFIAGVLVYFSWIIYRDSREFPEIVSTDPQIELSEYEIIRYNQAGDIEYSLEGDYLVHYDNERGSELTNPKILHYVQPSLLKSDADEKSTPVIDWQAESLTATISQDKNLVTLLKDVVLQKPNEENPQNTVTLTTDRLYIHDRGDKITSDIFVKIASPSRTISGVGVEGFPDKEQFTILRDVHSTFMTNQESSHE